MRNRLLVRMAWVWVLFAGGMTLIAAGVMVTYLIQFIMENWGPGMGRILFGYGVIIGATVFFTFTLWALDTVQDDRMSRQAETTEKEGKRKQ